MDILKVSNISKKFGSNQIIDDLSFTVKEHSIYGFLGQNGAGKTTVMKMILGLHPIDSGYIEVNKKSVTFGQNTTNKYIGYLADVPAFYDFMTASEYLRLCGEVSNIDKKQLKGRISELLNLVGLEDDRKKIGGYSRGMRQRLGIASALLGRPLLLICDEPTSALDPIGRKQILDILKSVSTYTTVIFSTHILADVERICDHVGILHQGKLVIDTDIETLKDKYNNHQIKLNFEMAEELSKFIANLDCQIVDQTECELIVSGITLEQIYTELILLDIYPVKIEVVRASLESVFLEVTNEKL